MSTQPEIRIEPSPADIAAAAARLFAALTRQASPTRPFNVALSGGSTPRLLYDLLTSAPFRHEIPWDSVSASSSVTSAGFHTPTPPATSNWPTTISSSP